MAPDQLVTALPELERLRMIPASLLAFCALTSAWIEQRVATWRDDVAMPIGG